MIYQSKLLPKARLELLESWIWYEDRQPGLGDRFKDEVYKAIHLVEQNPERYPVRKKPYREKNIDTFPYLIIYAIDQEAMSIIILSIFHAKRNPQKKYK